MTKKFNIVFAIMTEGSFQKQVLNGLRNSLEKQASGKFDIKVVKAAGSSPESLARNIEYYLPTTHAIVTVGFLATLAAKESTSKVAFPPPVFFTSVLDPVGVNIIDSVDKPSGNISGICLDSMPDIFPVQLIDRLAPHLKSFFLAYRTDAQGGRISFEVDKIKEYFRVRDKKVITLELNSGDDLSDHSEAIKKLLTNSDAVIIPALGLHESDTLKITNLANKSEVPVFGLSEDSLRDGAIIGFKTDLEFAGVKIAEYCIKSTIEKIPVSQLPVSYIQSNRRIIANPQAMKTYGVSFSDEILSSHDTLGQHHVLGDWPEIPVKEFGKVVSYKSEFDLNLNSAITKRSHKDEQAVYFSQMITGRVHDDEWQDVQTGFALDHKLQLFYCMGKKLTDMMIRKMHERDEHLPIIRTMTQEESKENTGIETPPPVKPMTTIVLPDPDPLMPLKLLLLVKPDIKTAALLCHIPAEHLTPRYVERFEKIKAFAQQHNIELTFVHEAMVANMKERLPEVCDSHDAVFFFEDTVHEIIPDWFAGVGDRHRALVCAGTTRHLEHLPLTYGMDKMVIRETLFAPVKAIMEKQEPMKDDIIISYDDVYRININPEACEKYGITVPVGLVTVLEASLMNGNGTLQK